jgi:hypothetical protein
MKWRQDNGKRTKNVLLFLSRNPSIEMPEVDIAIVK